MSLTSTCWVAEAWKEDLLYGRGKEGKSWYKVPLASTCKAAEALRWWLIRKGTVRRSTAD